MPDLARRVATHLIAAEGTAGAWELVLDDVRPGFARVSMRVRPDMLNGRRTAHGGMIFALADSAFAYVCNSRNHATVAQQASLAFLSPAREDETLIAEAREELQAGRSGVCSVMVRTADGRSIALFQGLSRAVGGPVLPVEETD
jgi:acyl-CoA thioesterase